MFCEQWEKLRRFGVVEVVKNILENVVIKVSLNFGDLAEGSKRADELMTCMTRKWVTDIGQKLLIA